MNLYEINETERRIMEVLELENIDREWWTKQLSYVKTTFNETCIAIGKHYRNTEAEIDVLAEEVRRLKHMITILQNRNQRSLDYLDENMRAAHCQKIDATLFKIRYRNLPPSLDIASEQDIPGEYMRIVPETRNPDRVAILNALKRGEDIPGCYVKTGQTKLEIV